MKLLLWAVLLVGLVMPFETAVASNPAGLKSDMKRALVIELREWAAQFDERPTVLGLNRTQRSLLLEEYEIRTEVMQEEATFAPLAGGSRFRRSLILFLRSRWDGRNSERSVYKLVNLQYKLLLGRRQLGTVIAAWDRAHK